MQYGEIIKKAWHTTWRYRYLWVLGLFAGITGPGGGGGGGNGGGGSGSNNGAGSASRPFGLTRQALMAQVQQWLPFALIVLFALLAIGLAFAILRIAARGGLVWAVDEIEQGRSPRLGHAWDVGFSRFWRLLGLALLVGVPVLIGVGLIAAGIAIPIVAAVARGGGASAVAAVVPVCGSLAIGIPALIVLSFVLGVMRVIGERSIVLENRGVFDAAGFGWHALRTGFKDTILMWLISWGLSIAAGLVIAIPIVILSLILFVPGAFAATGGSWGAVAGIAGVWVVIIVLVALMFTAIWGTFTSSLWTVFFRRLTGREVPPAPPAQYWSPTAPVPGPPYGPPVTPWGQPVAPAPFPAIPPGPVTSPPSVPPPGPPMAPSAAPPAPAPPAPGAVAAPEAPAPAPASPPAAPPGPPMAPPASWPAPQSPG